MARTSKDRSQKSKQNWEHGRGARKIGNPRYNPIKRNGRKVYKVR